MISSESLPELGEPTAEQATAWVAAALAEASALRKYDERLFPRSSEPAEVAYSNAVHRHWAAWSERAERLLALTRPLAERGERINWREQLSDASARTRAFLQITPESHARSLEAARRGDTIDGRIIREEVRARRRELDALAETAAVKV